MIKKNITFNLATFFFLYIAQTIPMSFFSTVIPVMMRQEKFTLSAIGLLQLIKLPWILKFLWSPIVDRYTMSTRAYKSWIIGSELIYAVLILVVALMDFHTDFYLIVSLIIVSFIASATQDIATDAFAVLNFSNKEKSMVNSMQSMGSFGGAMIGGGILLFLFKAIGWNDLLPWLSVFVVIALLPLIFNKNLQVGTKNKKERARLSDIYYFFARRTIWRQIGFLFLYYSGIIGILAMIKPYLVDLGYDMQEIGMMSGIAGTAIGFISSYCSGLIVKRIGCFRARILFAVIVLCATLYFVLLSYLSPSIVLLYLGIFLLWGSYGMATIVVYTTAMECVRTGREGTDFTIQTVVTHLSGVLVVILSGKVADLAGYHGLLIMESCLALSSLIYIICAFRKKNQIS